MENENNATETRIKKELETIDDYQADLESILYTKTIQQQDNSLSMVIKEESNTEDYCKQYDNFSLEHSDRNGIEDSRKSNETSSENRIKKITTDWNQRNTFHLMMTTVKCQFCEFTTNSTSKFRLHMNHHAENSIFKCPLCKYETVMSSHLKRHINSIHTKSDVYPCRYCHFIATSYVCLRNHIEEKHEKIVISGKINSQNEPKVQHITEVLKVNGTGTNSTKEVLARRARIIKGEKFQCQYCEYHTPFSDYLNIHINSRHTQNILYKCQYCEYNATKSYTLRCHVNSKHTKKVLYKCEHCNLETTRSNILKRHIERIHIKKSFNCQYCDYVAQKEGHMRNHLKRKHRIQLKTEDNKNQIKIESDIKIEYNV